ncbi:hypothetical protein CRUP_037804 [Coryphaenoides rupestris]|nr:hypothetical protein CRUP_037804 [Coryphaenoides rupestris]
MGLSSPWRRGPPAGVAASLRGEEGRPSEPDHQGSRGPGCSFRGSEEEEHSRPAMDSMPWMASSVLDVWLSWMVWPEPFWSPAASRELPESSSSSSDDEDDEEEDDDDEEDDDEEEEDDEDDAVAVASPHRMMRPLTSVRRRWLSSWKSSAAAEASFVPFLSSYFLYRCDVVIATLLTSSRGPTSSLLSTSRDVQVGRGPGRVPLLLPQAPCGTAGAPGLAQPLQRGAVRPSRTPAADASHRRRSHWCGCRRHAHLHFGGLHCRSARLFLEIKRHNHVADFFGQLFDEVVGPDVVRHLAGLQGPDQSLDPLHQPFTPIRQYFCTKGLGKKESSGQ